MKFRTKIVLCMITLLSILFGIGGSALISISFNSSLNREKNSVLKSYKMTIGTLQVANSIEAWSDKEDLLKILETISDKKNNSWSALRLFTGSGTFYEEGEAKNNFVNLTKNADTQESVMTLLTDKNNKKYLQITGAFKVKEETVYLDIAYDITSIYEESYIQQKTYCYIFIIMVSICGVLSYSISFVLTRPLSRLSRTTQAISKGNMSYRTRINSNDEIGSVAREFDKMADHIENDILELTDTMERQNQFVGNFTHELKTPMTSIIGYADLIRSQSLTEEELREAANYIFSEGKRLERLSLKLLDIFVMDNKEVKLVQYSPEKIVQNVVKNIKVNLKKNNIDIDCKCEKGVCLLDPDLICSLVINLIDNARKAMKTGGKILVISNMTSDGCKIVVKDNGNGMPESALKHITEAFYRVDKSRSRIQGGAGLGLALCAKIVKIHNGDIVFDSKENEGTTVMVELRGGRE